MRHLITLSQSNHTHAVPGKRYALTLQLMLKRSKKRKQGSSRSPKVSRETYHGQIPVDRPSGMAVNQVVNQPPISPTYDPNGGKDAVSHVAQTTNYMPSNQYVANADYIWRGFEATSNEQLPVWLSDQSLGGNSFSQNGIDAFLLPNDYLPPAPQIW